jgi:hypothetical protein
MNTSPLNLILRFVQGMAVGIIFFGGCALSAHAEDYPHASGGPVVRPQSAPEPSEFYVLLAGAGAVAAVLRRRRK